MLFSSLLLWIAKRGLILEWNNNDALHLSISA